MEGRRARGRERGLGLARTELPGPNGRAGPRPVQRRALAPHQALRTGRQAGASTRSTTKTTTAPATRARRQRLLSQPAATRGIAATGSRLGADAGVDEVGRFVPRRVLGAASPLRRFGTTGSVRRGAPFRLARRFLTQSPVRAVKGHADGRDAAQNCTPDLLATLGVRGVADRPRKAGAELALRSLPPPAPHGRSALFAGWDAHRATGGRLTLSGPARTIPPGGSADARIDHPALASHRGRDRRPRRGRDPLVCGAQVPMLRAPFQRARADVSLLPLPDGLAPAGSRPPDLTSPPGGSTVRISSFASGTPKRGGPASRCPRASQPFRRGDAERPPPRRSAASRPRASPARNTGRAPVDAGPTRGRDPERRSARSLAH